MKKKNSSWSNFKYYSLVVQFFIEVFVGIAIGYFGGQYLDSLLFDDKQILIYILLILGVFSALVNLARRALRMIKQDEGGNDSE